jgi:hypothetical protein
MLLRHTTYREHCPSIAIDGLTDGKEGFVCLTPQAWSWRHNEILPLEAIYRIGRDEVVRSYDVPDDVAGPYLVEPQVFKPGHPNYDPEIEDYDPDNDVPWHEYRMPADLVNKYFAGVAFWHGECPFRSDEIKLLWERRFGEV